MQRIFVQMVSYRDPECQATLADLFAKAAYPTRISVGLCLQYDPVHDVGCGLVSFAHSQQIQTITYTPQQAKGAGWARNEAQAFYQGEEYVLQIQAHMRFEQGWDETLINMLEALPGEKNILTAWLPNYTPPNQKQLLQGEIPVAVINRLGDKNDAQMVHLIKRMARQDAYAEPFPTAMWVGNFMFARGKVLREVPFDPHVYFWGEEINFSARLWTHGYDIYHLNRVVLYHYWDREGVKGASIYRNHHDARNQQSLARNLHLFGMQTTNDSHALEAVERYPLGTERRIDDYWKFIGVNWQARTIAHFVQTGHFTTPNNHSLESTIFVSIASYRDPEISATIASMFANAVNPDRIHVGVCLQNEADDISADITSDRMEQIRIVRVAASESKGANWARAQAMGLHQDEAFILQIDSHMRFEPGWDVMLLDMYSRVPSKRAVLSAYLPNFEPPNDLQANREGILRMCVRRMGETHDAQIVHLTGLHMAYDSPFTQLLQTPFVIANFMFAAAEVWRQVPLDPHLYFYGDEITMSARLWTHGIDIFQPDRVVAYHYWARMGELHKHPYRVKRKIEANVSRERVRHLLQLEQAQSQAAIENITDYGLGEVRSLADFWQVAGINPLTHTASLQALSGQWSMRRDAHAGEEILVRIASYRDPELLATTQDLFAKADKPERVFVAVCCQYDPADAPTSFDIPTRPEQVRMAYAPWRDSNGVCWARAQTELLWGGESYTLQIDSHTRLVQGWDRLMIEELARCPSEKPVLSCNPARYTPPHRLDSTPKPTIRVANPFTKEGNLRCRGVELDHAPSAPLRGAFIAAGFVFSRAEILREVPYDPYYYFNQEEISYALRLYTHGYDVYSASAQLIYHFYNEDGNAGRPMHWDDTQRTDEKKIRFLAARGLARLDHITGHRQSTDERTLREIELFGLGKVRSVADFERFTGLDFAKKIASERALNGEFIEGYITAEKIQSGRALALGEMMPYFSLPDADNIVRSIDKFVGKLICFFFLPAINTDAYLPLFSSLDKALLAAGKPECWVIFVMDASVDDVKKYKTKHRLPHIILADATRAVANAFAVPQTPCGFLLGHDLRLYGSYQGNTMIEAMISDMISYRDHYKQRFAKPLIVENGAPALIIPEVFPASYCDQLIAHFNAGESFEGMVGSDDNPAYNPKSKVRRDILVEEPLLSDIDQRLANGIFQHIENIYGFQVAHRELYKIGCYSAEEGGFFAAHRDNFEPELGYRRVAMTINLSDDYDGGALRFPEYGEHLYRPTRGSAIIFSCSMMHEVQKVTRGKRYVLLAFFHSKQDEAHRQEMRAMQNKPLMNEAYTMLHPPKRPLSFARDFYRKWLLKS